MTWTSLLPVKGVGRRVEASASDMASAPSACPEGLALKMRRDMWPDVVDWSSRRDPHPFLLGAVVGAVRDIELYAVPVADAIATQVSRRSGAGLEMHGGVKNFVRHAVGNYLEAAAELESESPGLRLMPSMMEWRVTDNATLTVYGMIYVSPTGIREVRRLRYGSARPPDEDGLTWASAAAIVVSEGETSHTGAPIEGSCHRVRVVEVGLNDASTRVVFDAPPTDVGPFFEANALKRLRASTVANGLHPSRDCARCKHLGGCSALPRSPGVIGVTSKGRNTRSVSASDLDTYRVCPARYFLERVCHLPRPLPNEDGLSSPAKRGMLVHEWLRKSHLRGVPCTMGDLPEPDAPSIGLADGFMSRFDYAEIRPFLVQHVQHCPLRFDSFAVESVEESHRFFDPDCDVVVAAAPDITGRYDGTLVWRETRTTAHALPLDESDVMDRYLSIALDLLLLEAVGDGSSAVELEVLRNNDSQLYVLSVDDHSLLEQARRNVVELARAWRDDDKFAAAPGPHCTWCPMLRFCPDASTSASGATSAGVPVIPISLEDISDDDDDPD